MLTTAHVVGSERGFAVWVAQVDDTSGCPVEAEVVGGLSRLDAHRLAASLTEADRMEPGGVEGPPCLLLARDCVRHLRHPAGGG